jgi:hypothetical protein
MEIVVLHHFCKFLFSGKGTPVLGRPRKTGPSRTTGEGNEFPTPSGTILPKAAARKARSFLPCTFGKNDVHRRRPALCRFLFFATLLALLGHSVSAILAAHRLLGP